MELKKRIAELILRTPRYSFESRHLRVRYKSLRNENAVTLVAVLACGSTKAATDESIMW
jgi:hypothetical protein